MIPLTFSFELNPMAGPDPQKMNDQGHLRARVDRDRNCAQVVDPGPPQHFSKAHADP